MTDISRKGVCKFIKTSKRANTIRRMSHRLGREVGAPICEKNGQLYIAQPHVGRRFEAKPYTACPGGRFVGVIHTHPVKGHETLVASIDDISGAAFVNIDLSCILAAYGRDGVCYHLTPSNKEKILKEFPDFTYSKDDDYIEDEIREESEEIIENGNESGDVEIIKRKRTPHLMDSRELKRYYRENKQRIAGWGVKECRFKMESLEEEESKLPFKYILLCGWHERRSVERDFKKLAQQGVKMLLIEYHELEGGFPYGFYAIGVNDLSSAKKIQKQVYITNLLYANDFIVDSFEIIGGNT